jgi:hypothetical protein
MSKAASSSSSSSRKRKVVSDDNEFLIPTTSAEDEKWKASPFPHLIHCVHTLLDALPIPSAQWDTAFKLRNTVIKAAVQEYSNVDKYALPPAIDQVLQFVIPFINSDNCPCHAINMAILCYHDVSTHMSSLISECTNDSRKHMLKTTLDRWWDTFPCGDRKLSPSEHARRKEKLEDIIRNIYRLLNEKAPKKKKK